MGSRRKGRVLAFQALYGWDFTHAPVDDVVAFRWFFHGDAADEERAEHYRESLDFARLLVLGTLENLPAVDEAIRRQLEHWDFSRLAKVDRAILRLGAYALLYQKTIPASVTIDEAIDIAKEYGSDESYKFVNGVLDGIRKGMDRP